MYLDRMWLRIFAALIGITMLAGCTSGTSSDDEESSQSKGAEFPVKIKHKFGTTTIKSKPDRVASVALNANGVATDLSANLVVIEKNTSSSNGLDPWLPKKANPDAVLLDSFKEFDFEKIAAQKPDLILMTALQSNATQDDYDRMSQIAPTIGPSTTSETETELLIGQALGQADAVQDKLDQAEEAVAKVRKKYSADGGATVGYGLISEDNIGIQVDPKTAPAVGFLQDLGLKIAPEIKKGFKDQGQARPPGTYLISYENVDVLDSTELLLLGTFGSGVKEKFEPLAKRLPAAKAGNLNYVDFTVTYALQAIGSYNTDWLLERLTPYLKKLADSR